MLSACPCSKAEAAKVAYFSRLRLRDQIVDGVLRYEKLRERSLEFAQTTMASWLNIALMAAKLGEGAGAGIAAELDMFYEGLGDGHAFKVCAAALVSCALHGSCSCACICAGLRLFVMKLATSWLHMGCSQLLCLM